MRKILMVGSVVVLGTLGSGCSGGDEGGACIVPSLVRTPDWDACHNKWSADECKSREGQYSSNSCQDIGFTVTCPADGSNSYRRTGYSC